MNKSAVKMTALFVFGLFLSNQKFFYDFRLTAFHKSVKYASLFSNEQMRE